MEKENKKTKGIEKKQKAESTKKKAKSNKIPKNKIRVIFVSGIGRLLGSAIINKEDVFLLHEFSQKSHFTDCVIEKEKERMVLSRSTLREVREALQ